MNKLGTDAETSAFNLGIVVVVVVIFDDDVVVVVATAAFRIGFFTRSAGPAICVSDDAAAAGDAFGSRGAAGKRGADAAAATCCRT